MPKTYKVGGAVRDKLLGIESKDIDFTFVLDDLEKTVEEGFREMEKWMKDEGFEIFLSTPDMFTIRARFPKGHKNDGLVADFVMARKEVGYLENTRRPILVLGTLEDDLARRDFTINAMAECEDGTICDALIDPFNGRKDLKSGILRTPLPAEQTMMDDPLRFLRAMRFSITKDLVMENSIIKAMQQPHILDKLKNVVSAERVREEVYKMMKCDTVRTIYLFRDMDERIPGIIELVFSRGLWLKPTFEL